MVKDHDVEQYPFLTPNITKSAVNWTERALSITNNEAISILESSEQEIFSNLNKTWRSTREKQIISIFSSLLFIISLLNIIFGPKYYSINIKKPVNNLFQNLSTFFRGKNISKEVNPLPLQLYLGLFFTFSFIFSYLIKILRINFTKFLVVNVALHMLYPMLFSSIILFLYEYYKDFKNFSEVHKSRSKKIELFLSKRIYLLAGAFLGLIFSVLAMIYSSNLAKSARKESIINPIPQIDNIFLSMINLVVIVILIQQLLHWKYTRFIRWCDGKENLKKTTNGIETRNQMNSVIFTPILGFISSLFTSSIRYSHVVLDFNFIRIPVFFAVCLIFSSMFLFIEILNLFVWKAQKNPIFSSIIITIISAWIMVSSFLAF